MSTPPGAVNSSQFVLFTAPMLAGTQGNWALLGILTLQVYRFTVSFPNERLWIKMLVYSLYVLEVIQTAITSHFVYELLVFGWGNPQVFVKLPWSSLATPIFTGITSCAVQLFFARRILLLKGDALWGKCIAALIALLALMQSLAAIISDARFAVTTELTEIARLMDGVKVWLIGSAVCDVTITLTLIAILGQYRQRTPWQSTDGLITKLIFNTVETGLVTTVVALCDVTLFILFSGNNLHQTPALMLGKLYTIMLVVTLNARTRNRSLSASTALAQQPRSIDHTQSHEMAWRRTFTLDPSAAQKVHINTIVETVTDLESGQHKNSPSI